MESPEIGPITTLQGVYSWKPCGDRESCPHACKFELRTTHSDPCKPKTLVCHDMMGGYLNDRFPQGFSSLDCYNFLYWNYIDTFVYFTHQFLTIPPPCWSNAAHSHGVKSLGTLITEWENGTALCNEFLKDESCYLSLVTKMVEIAYHYNFDGWLINIENEVAKDKVPLLLGFLTDLTKSMKSKIPHSEVIWYDSVTMEGKLEWQNELNGLNKPFFEVCDGIFLNYTWAELNLINSKTASNSRVKDIYVGIDVFGRGCFGGGGFETNKAVHIVQAHDLSIALFAPGWVYECHGSKNFLENQQRFWKLLLPYLHFHKLDSFPIATDFCAGQGMKFHIEGICVDRSPWNNVSCQGYQTLLLPYSTQDSKHHKVSYSFLEAYNGSGSYHFTGMFDTSNRQKTYELIHCHVQVSSQLVFSHTTMSDMESSCDFAFYLEFDGSPKFTFLSPSGTSSAEYLCKLVSDQLLCEDTALQDDGLNDYIVMSSTQNWSANCSAFDLLENSKWTTHEYVLRGRESSSQTLIKVGIIIIAKPFTCQTGSNYSLFLGQIKVAEDSQRTHSFPKTIDIFWNNLERHSNEGNSSMCVSFKLSWKIEGSSKEIHHFDIFLLNRANEIQVTKFLGRAFSNTYEVRRLEIFESQILILVRPVMKTYVGQDFLKCPKLLISFS